MRFLPQKRRATPSVIIVSLVDVLMVVLIFLVVSTTFKDAQAYIELAASENPDGVQEADTQVVIIAIPRDVDHVLVEGKEFTLKELGPELKKRLAERPNLTVTIDADGKVDWEKIVAVRGTAKSAGVKHLNASVENQP